MSYDAYRKLIKIYRNELLKKRIDLNRISKETITLVCIYRNLSVV